MYQNYDAALSKTIMFLRFPLIVSVVFIHAGLEGVVIGGNVTVHDGQFPIYESVYHVITNELARVSVPLFFFISGFLFFYRTDFSMKAYGQKLKNASAPFWSRMYSGMPQRFWRSLQFKFSCPL